MLLALKHTHPVLETAELLDAFLTRVWQVHSAQKLASKSTRAVMPAAICQSSQVVGGPWWFRKELFGKWAGQVPFCSRLQCARACFHRSSKKREAREVNEKDETIYQHPAHETSLFCFTKTFFTEGGIGLCVCVFPARPDRAGKAFGNCLRVRQICTISFNLATYIRDRLSRAV